MEKLAFSILVKNIKLLGCLFFYRTCLYILFDKVLEQKQAFLELKNNLLQKSKICIFAKGLLLVKNLKFIACVIFHRIGQEILFDNFLGIKEAFLDYEKVTLENWKNWDFRKGVYLRFLSKT